MKKFIYILLVSILGFTSCKKTEYHKVMFEITFLQTPSNGSSNFIEVNCNPSYASSGKGPTIDRFNIPQVWRYEYLGLERGQKVLFGVRGQLSYHYEMKVYIDGTQVSYLKVKVSDSNYYDDHVEASSGLNTSQYDTGLIEFVY